MPLTQPARLERHSSAMLQPDDQSETPPRIILRRAYWYRPNRNLGISEHPVSHAGIRSVSVARNLGRDLAGLTNEGTRQLFRSDRCDLGTPTSDKVQWKPQCRQTYWARHRSDQVRHRSQGLDLSTATSPLVLGRIGLLDEEAASSISITRERKKGHFLHSCFHSSKSTPNTMIICRDPENNLMEGY
jgi:hypothetical protein